MTSQSQTRKKKGVQYQHKGHSLTRKSTMDSFFFSLSPPHRRSNFLGGAVWHHAKHKVTETDSYPGKKVIASTGCPHLHGLFRTLFPGMKSANTLRGAGSRAHCQRHTKALTQDNYHGGSPEHQTRLRSGLGSIARLATCTALPRPALSRARGLASGSGTLREQVNANCIPHRAYLSELHTDRNFSTQFRARSPSVKFSIPPSTYFPTQRVYTGRTPSHQWIWPSPFSIMSRLT